MPAANFKRFPRNAGNQQKGAAFLVMLVIMIVGISAFLISSLSSISVKNERDSRTADVLVQAKEALIGYAVSDANRPGEIPCPDINNDGSADYAGGAGFPCSSLIGRLPWRTLGLPDLRDASGERLWYTVSEPFHAGDDAVLNSDTPGNYPADMISVSGNVVANNVIAIVFAAGQPLASATQNRSAANENDHAHYLESVATFPTSFQSLTPNDSGSGDYTYNDRMLLITHDDLMPLVEYRIVREAKQCLDEYAASDTTNHNYPWPGKISNNDYTSYYNASYILFGRLPIRPNVFTTNPVALQLIDDLFALQIALNAYESNVTTATRTALDAAGDTLKDYADCIDDGDPGCTGSPIHGSTADDAKSAGDRAQDLAEAPPTSTVAAVQSKIDETIDGLISDGVISHASTSMPIFWTNCPLLAAPSNAYAPADYWDDWKAQLFYQVANNCRPYWGTCSATGGNLEVNGSGNPYAGTGTYRASVILSRKILGTQVRPNTTTSNYLESTNIQIETDTTPNPFVTYKKTDAGYATVNDLVACIDGYHSTNFNPAAKCK